MEYEKLGVTIANDCKPCFSQAYCLIGVLSQRFPRSPDLIYRKMINAVYVLLAYGPVMSLSMCWEFLAVILNCHMIGIWHSNEEKNH